MLRQSIPFALKFLQSQEQGCGKLLCNAAVISSRTSTVAGAQAQEAGVTMKVAQYSTAEAEALAAKQKHITGAGLGDLSLKPTRAMGSFASGKAFSTVPASAAAAQAAAEPAKPNVFNRMMKAAAALVAAVALALAPTAAADAPSAWQFGFQDMATSTGQAAVDLHHDIMFFVITVATLVLYLTFQFATKFHYSHQPIAEKLTHHTTLEVLWTVFPTIIVLFIGIPSLTLIYSMDQHTDRPGLTVKVIGRQWYWSYEMHDHLQHKLVDPDRLVAIAEKSVKA